LVRALRDDWAKGDMMIHGLLARYDAGATMLAYAAQGLSREQETARPGPGRWSIAELLTHLLDSDLVYAERMKRVIAEERPPLVVFDEAAWVERLHSHDSPVEEAVNLFVANRRWMLRVLKRCSESDFARVGIHSEAGEQTLAEIVAAIAHHVDHHLKFLYAKRAILGVALYPRYTDE
jgi:uncharacterized damage-inducible protein DinB